MPSEAGRIPFVQRIDKGGRVRLYFRRGGFRRPLRSPDGSEALRDEVDAILAELAQIERAKTPRPGSVIGALKAYNRSADFLGLARSTQAEYQRLIDELIDDVGAVHLGDVSTGLLLELRDAWAPRGHRAAYLRLQVLKNALTPAIADGRVPGDPFAKVSKVRRPHDTAEPNPVWRDDEVEAVIELAIARGMPGLARAVALGRWGGFRRGTICQIPLHALVTGHDRSGNPHPRFSWTTTKGKVLADKPQDARFADLIARTPSRAWTIAYNKRGDRWQPRQLNQALGRLISRLAQEGKARPNLTIHGLRHSRGVELAHAGASDAEIMSQLEHATERMASIYRRQAERRHMADAGQAKVDKAIRARTTARGESP